MKLRALCMALYVAGATAFAAETEADWYGAFERSFYESLGGAEMAMAPAAWLEKYRDLFSAAAAEGAPPAETGERAANLMSEWDLSIRSGITIQEAAARFRQSFLLETRGTQLGATRLSALRRESDKGVGSPGPDGGSPGGNSGTGNLRLGRER